VLIGVQQKAHKFVAAYSAFLKRQGKLPVPGEYIPFFFLADILHR